jgi:hypothetical protein
MGWELWGLFDFEGLDNRICWGFCGKKMRGALRCGFASGGDDEQGKGKYGDSGFARMTNLKTNAGILRCAQNDKRKTEADSLRE